MRQRINNNVRDLKKQVKSKVGRAKMHIEHGVNRGVDVATDGFAYAYAHRAEVAKYAGTAGKTALKFAKKGKKAGVAVGTGMALIGLAVACKRSMDKANRQIEADN